MQMACCRFSEGRLPACVGTRYYLVWRHSESVGKTLRFGWSGGTLLVFSSTRKGTGLTSIEKGFPATKGGVGKGGWVQIIGGLGMLWFKRKVMIVPLSKSNRTSDSATFHYIAWQSFPSLLNTSYLYYSQKKLNKANRSQTRC